MKLTKEQVGEMIKLVESGEPIWRIAKKFNVRVQTVYYHLNKLHPERISVDSVRHAKSLNKRKKALELYRKGVPIKEIAKIVGLKENTVKYYLNGFLKRGINLTDDDVREILLLARKGFTLDEIAKKYNLKPQTLKRKLWMYASLKEGDKLPDGAELITKKDRHFGNISKKVVELHRNGMSNVEIARLFDLNLLTINKLLKKYGDR